MHEEKAGDILTSNQRWAPYSTCSVEGCCEHVVQVLLLLAFLAGLFPCLT